MTTKSDIRTWLERGREEGATHMLVVCDTFEYEDYPVYVKPQEDINLVATQYNGVNMQRIMECYCLSLNWDSQLTTTRCWNGWGPQLARK